PRARSRAGRWGRPATPPPSPPVRARSWAGAAAAGGRDAEAIADLADAVRAARSRTGAEPPEPGETRRYTLEVDDERVPARLVADENGGWRVEVPERLDAPEPADTNVPAPRQPERPMSRLRRLWEALKAGFRGQNPKYPSGSGVDSAGQSLLGHEAGLPLTKHYDPTSTPGDEYDVLQTKFNPARILKEAVTMWRKRELIPLLKRLTSRVAGRAAEYDTPTTRDGEQYRYWLEEADPELVRRELGVELEDLQRQAEDAARALPAPETRPELTDGETPGTTMDQSMRPGEELPASTGELADWLHELSEASARRQELADVLAAAADALGIDLGAPNAENVRRAVDLLRYQQVRRIGSLTGLAEASRRYNAEHERIPFSEEIGFFDANPMNRFLGEVVRAFGGNPTLLNWEGVNNGGEPSREWGDLYDTDQPGQDQGLRAFFENALRRDQIMDERSVWAQLLGTDLHALDPNQLADTLAEEMDRIREHARGLAGFLADAEDFLLADAEVDELTGLIGDMAGREWVLAQGGVLLEDGTGLGLVPGEPGGPMRLVVVDGRLDHDRVIADALAEYPRLAEAVNEGIVEVHYLISDVQPGRPLPEGGFTPERIAIVDGGATQVRHFTGAVEGRRLEATVVNDGDGWRVVPDAPVDPDALPAEAPESLSREEIGTAIDELTARLGITEAELGSPQLLAERLAVLRDENAIRAGQIEAIIDYARTAWDIDTYHQVGDTRNLLAHRLGLEPAEMTPRRLAETIADTDTRNALRQQRAEALVEYAKLLRGMDPDAIDAANDRLVRRLDALPGTVRITGIAQLGEVIANLSQRPNLHPNLVDALTDYADALAAVDVFDPDTHGDRAIDPRVSDIEFPVHDKAVRHLLDVIGDVAHLTEAPARLGMLDGDTGIPPGPDRGASRDFARLVGVDLTDAGPERWAEVYEVYRDGKLDQHERLTPAQLAEVQAELRAEVVQRAADIAALTDLVPRADLEHLSAQREAAAREVANARADLADARRGLPVNDEDLTPDALDDVLDGLRGRTMQVDEQGPWQNRVAELEHAARRVFDADTELARLDDALEQATRAADPPSSGRTREPDSPASEAGAQESARAAAEAELERLSAQRDTAAHQLAVARADLADARRGLPVNDEDLTRDALDDALDELRGRTMRVDEQQSWQDRLAGLEHAARRVFAAEDELSRLDEAVEQAARSVESNESVREQSSHAASESARAEADAERARLSAERDAAARQLADAQTELADARRGLPVSDEDLTRDALDDALDGLRSRTLRVNEQGPWQERVAELERAAR
uniref:hypothetical protein n=1 Tax=Nocardia gipuzkoensis TaxID=2749991 RepID=UPI00245898F2